MHKDENKWGVQNDAKGRDSPYALKADKGDAPKDETERKKNSQGHFCYFGHMHKMLALLKIRRQNRAA